MWVTTWAPAAQIRAHRPYSAKSAPTTGGDDGNRTHVQGFAGPCLNHSATSPARSRLPRPRTRPHTISPRCGNVACDRKGLTKATRRTTRSTGLADRPSANPVVRLSTEPDPTSQWVSPPRAGPLRPFCSLRHSPPISSHATSCDPSTCVYYRQGSCGCVSSTGAWCHGPPG